MIGGSAGLALRAAGHTVVGYARRPEVRARARQMGAADTTPDTLAKAAGADIVMLAAPVLALRQLMNDLAPHLTPGTIVTDVASTKRTVERWARHLLPAHVHFVGGHPMAGKERAGIEHAEGALFRGRTWCIVPPPTAEARAVDAVTRLAACTGARPLRISAGEHDRAVAATSHLPFTASLVLALTVLGRPEFPRLATVAGSGLRDMTRLASGDPVMHRDICLSNRDHLVRELELLADRLAEVTDVIRRLPDPEFAEGDPRQEELERLLGEIKSVRDSWQAGDLA